MERDVWRVQEGRRDRLRQDVPQNQDATPSHPSPPRRHGHDPRRETSVPPRPPRDRAGRPAVHAQRDDRDLRGRGGNPHAANRDRERGGRERDIRDRDGRDGWDNREGRDGLRDLRRVQGCAEDRHRGPSNAWQGRRQGRSRSRSP
jgi:hypothetical protein